MKLEFAVGMLALSIVLAIGCLSREAKEAIADGAYAAEHMRCVDANETRAEIDACRRAVRVRWQIEETVTKYRDSGIDQ